MTNASKEPNITDKARQHSPHENATRAYSVKWVDMWNNDLFLLFHSNWEPRNSRLTAFIRFLENCFLFWRVLQASSVLDLLPEVATFSRETFTSSPFIFYILVAVKFILPSRNADSAVRTTRTTRLASWSFPQSPILQLLLYLGVELLLQLHSNESPRGIFCTTVKGILPSKNAGSALRTTRSTRLASWSLSQYCQKTTVRKAKELAFGTWNTSQSVGLGWSSYIRQ